MRWMTFAVLVLPLVGCYEPEVAGLIDADDNCSYPVDGSVRHEGVLDVGPTPSLAHTYDAVVLLDKAWADQDVTFASVAFSDTDSVDLPDVDVEGRTFTFPSVEGERVDPVQGRTDQDGRAAVPFTLVTLDEAAALQQLTALDEDFELLVEIRAVVGGVDTPYPYFATLRVCQQCLVGVGAALDGEALVCPDQSAPVLVDEPPCEMGQDDVYSTCSG